MKQRHVAYNSRHLSMLLAIAQCVSIVLPANAQSKAERVESGEQAVSVSSLADQGEAHYHAREYKLAIDTYVRAFALDPDPNLVFNIARCHEKLGEVTAAIRRYEEYIALPGADTDGRVRAQTAINDLKRLAALQAEARDEGQASRDVIPNVKPMQAQQSVPAEARDRASQASKPARAPRQGNASEASLGTWPWITLGAGIVILGGGSVLYLLGSRDHQSLREADNYDSPGEVYALTRAQAEGRRDRGDNEKLWGLIAASTGGALLVTSFVLLTVSGDEKEKTAIEVSPAVGGATLELRGTW